MNSYLAYTLASLAPSQTQAAIQCFRVCSGRGYTANQARPLRADHPDRPGRHGRGAARACSADPPGSRSSSSSSSSTTASRVRRRSSTCCSTRRASPRSSSIPNVVDIYDLGQAEGRYFIAMEYLEGEPLLAVLRAGREGKRLDRALDRAPDRRHRRGPRRRPRAAHACRGERARARASRHLARQHRRALQRAGEARRFRRRQGDAVARPASRRCRASSATWRPRSSRARRAIAAATSSRSAACMWEALTLKRLFRGGNDAETMKQVLESTIQPPSKVNGDVPPEYDPIVMRALERDPDRRHARRRKRWRSRSRSSCASAATARRTTRSRSYMQETFKSHIDARKKLVQEVVSKGSASAEVLDAAFSDRALASGSPVTPAAPAHRFLDEVSPPADTRRPACRP